MSEPINERIGRIDERLKSVERWQERFDNDESERKERWGERVSLAVQAAVSAALGWIVGHFTIHFHN